MVCNFTIHYFGKLSEFQKQHFKILFEVGHPFLKPSSNPYLWQVKKGELSFVIMIDSPIRFFIKLF